MLRGRCPLCTVIGTVENKTARMNIMIELSTLKYLAEMLEFLAVHNS